MNNKLIIIVVIFLSTSFAHSAIYVSTEFPIEVQSTATVPPQRIVPILLLPEALPGNKIEVQIEVKNAVYRDITAFITDQTNLNLFSQRVPFRFVGRQRAIAPFSLTATTWGHGRYYLVLDNSYAGVIAKQIAYKATVTTRLDPSGQQALKGMLEGIYDGLKREYEFRDFDITVKACGQSNAFSNPNITLCAELITELLMKNRPGAISAILLHELGHTLLNLWGIPGYDNEDIVDEFSAAMLLKSPSGLKALSELIEWHSEKDVRAEAQQMIMKGSRHSLSVQRVRNLQRIIANPKPVISRWNNLLYPKMTEFGLRKILASPSIYDDVPLAQELVAQK